MGAYSLSGIRKLSRTRARNSGLVEIYDPVTDRVEQSGRRACPRDMGRPGRPSGSPDCRVLLDRRNGPFEPEGGGDHPAPTGDRRSSHRSQSRRLVRWSTRATATRQLLLQGRPSPDRRRRRLGGDITKQQPAAELFDPATGKYGHQPASPSMHVLSPQGLAAERRTRPARTPGGLW